jgi:hypothetical protein
MRARFMIACAVVLAAAAAAVTVWLRAAPGTAPPTDACFNPPPQPPDQWMRPFVGCTCAESEMTDEESPASRLAAEARSRLAAEARRRRKAELVARIDAVLSEESTHRAAADACREEGARCEPGNAWREPLYCLGRGMSGARWHERARLHGADAESAENRARALTEELGRLAIQACCDHLYVRP